ERVDERGGDVHGADRLEAGSVGEEAKGDRSRRTMRAQCRLDDAYGILLRRAEPTRHADELELEALGARDRLARILDQLRRMLTCAECSGRAWLRIRSRCRGPLLRRR